MTAGTAKRITAARRFRASSELGYPFAAPAADGSVVEVAPGVLWARMPMPMALDHINVYLLRGETGWTIVDTGLNTDACRSLWEHIAAKHLQGLPVEALLCTHFHYDHAGLASWITERFGVPLYMTLGEYMMLRVFGVSMPDPPPPEVQQFYARSGMPPERVERMFTSLRQDPFMPPRVSSYRRLREGDSLNIGQRRWQVLIGEGHSPEHACLYCAEDQLLIAGDQLLPRISSNVLVSPSEPDGNPLQQWFDSLDRLDGCAAETLVLPSHQSVFRGLHARVQELRDHHQHQFDVLRTYLAEAETCTAFEAMNHLFPHLRHAFDDMLALGETIAHLSWLRCDAAVQRTLEGDGAYRFSAAVVATEDRGAHW
jgi:glyoxylase-like metal-dependent hydrolase (beta-lactamase superfamily II)